MKLTYVKETLEDESFPTAFTTIYVSGISVGATNIRAFELFRNEMLNLAESKCISIANLSTLLSIDLSTIKNYLISFHDMDRRVMTNDMLIPIHVIESIPKQFPRLFMMCDIFSKRIELMEICFNEPTLVQKIINKIKG